MDVATNVTKGSVLIADADPAGRGLLQAALLDAGWEVFVAPTAKEALDILQTRTVSAGVLDLRLPDISGPAWLQQACSLCPGLPVLAIATEPTVEMAVEAMRAGARNVLTRPISAKSLARRLESLVPPHTDQPVRLGRCISIDPTLAVTLQQAGRLAGSNTPVAICGAPGTGRKTLAAAMQEAARPQRPIMLMDLTFLSPEQVRAQAARAIESPNIALTIADIQCLKTPDQDRLATLVRAIVGAQGAVVVTLSDLPDRLVEKGLLNRPLAEMLAGGVLRLPPLARRRVDLPLLARQILDETFSHKPLVVSSLAMEALTRYDWPGNVRQLRLVLERAGRLAGDEPIEPRHLPIMQAVKRDPVMSDGDCGSPINLQQIVDDVERNLIAMALRRTGRNQAKAAEFLGIPRTTLRDKLNKYGFLTDAPRTA